MCGRYTLSTPGDLVAEVFSAEEAPDLVARYNIAPTQEAPVVRRRGGGDSRAARVITPARWGLIPAWADGPAIGNRLINARSETVAERPAFKDAFRRRRCLVPADGFYEWKGTRGARQPYLFRPRKSALFALAGLWESFRDGPLTIESFTILTTEANELVARVHGRMPVILEPSAWDRWLAPSHGATPSDLADLLRPAASESMEAFAVSTWVNDPAHDDPRCAEPLPSLF